MTALLGAAVLGLVPLPSMATSNSWPSHSGLWPTRGKAANSARPNCTPQANIERMGTHEELARLRHELAGIDANMTKTGVRGDAMK